MGGAPYAPLTYLYAPQLKRPVAMVYQDTMLVGEDGGVEANRFVISPAALSPQGLADIPGLSDVTKAQLGVGQLTCKRSSTCLQAFHLTAFEGIVDVTPANGFAAYVTRPHFDQAAAVFRENVTLVRYLVPTRSQKRLAFLGGKSRLEGAAAAGARKRGA